jgi:proline dehydrogenase
MENQIVSNLKSGTQQLSFDNTEIAFKRLSDKKLKKGFWLFKTINNTSLVKVGPAVTNFALKLGLPIKSILKHTLFQQFCGGENLEDCQETIDKFAEYNVGTILDYSVEGNKDEASFDQTQEEIIKTLIKSATLSHEIPFAVFKISGVVRFSLFEKLSAGITLSEIEQKEFEKAKNRIQVICQTAFDLDVKLMIDAEESWIQPTIDDFAFTMMQQFNKQKAIIFNTYQLYRNDKLASLKADTLIAEASGFYLGVKLVRGAYMEKERKRAEEENYTSPIHLSKKLTDDDFNDSLRHCTDFIERIFLVVGTHNEYSCKLLTYLMQERNIVNNHPNIYFSQLLGMSDNLSFNLANANYNVAKYVPYGPIKSVMPYLFRRAKENTAIAGQAGRELQLYETEIMRREMLK